MESTLDLRQIVGILRKHILLIILSMIGFAIVAFGIAEFAMTPQYTSTTQLLVNQKKMLMIRRQHIKTNKLMSR